MTMKLTKSSKLSALFLMIVAARCFGGSQAAKALPAASARTAASGKELSEWVAWKKVMEVVMGHSNAGCEGLGDLETHWLMKLWPGAKSWPRKGAFHGQKKALDSTEGASYELHAQLVRGLSNAALKLEEESKHEIVRHAIEGGKMKLPALAAAPQVVEQGKRRKKMHNFTPTKKEQAKEVQRVCKAVKEKDESNASRAAEQNEPRAKRAKKPTPPARAGAEGKVNNYLKHIEKVRHSDLLGP